MWPITALETQMKTASVIVYGQIYLELCVILLFSYHSERFPQSYHVEPILVSNSRKYFYPQMFQRNGGSFSDELRSLWHFEN
jgi:hypothetical protein